MSESLSKRVAQFVGEQAARRTGKARAVVVALREEIAKARDDGWSVKAIWQTLHADGSIHVGYHAFRRYVAELVPAQSPAPAAATIARPTARESPVAGHSRSFQHERVPQLKDIY
jgi:hypothetical protein